MKLNHKQTTATRAVLSHFGAEGYGILWLLREAMAENGGSIPIAMCDVIARAARVEMAIVKCIALDFGLFALDGDMLTDEEEQTARKSREDAAAKAAAARWNKKTKQRKAKQPQVATTDPNDGGFVVTVADIYKEAEDDDLARLNKWAQGNTPYLANPRNIRQLTADELRKLKEKFGTPCIMETMQGIENRKDLRKKYSTLYFTLNNWCKKSSNNGTTNRQSFSNDGRNEAKQSVVNRLATIAEREGVGCKVP